MSKEHWSASKGVNRSIKPNNYGQRLQFFEFNVNLNFNNEIQIINREEVKHSDTKGLDAFCHKKLIINFIVKKPNIILIR